MITKAVVTLLVGAASLSLLVQPAGASEDDATAVMAQLNEYRKANGLPVLTRDARVNEIAQRWAEHMAAEGQLSHNDALGAQLPPWSFMGENVGFASSAEEMMQTWMASPGHNANMLDRSFTMVGVAAVTVGDQIWFVQDFMTPKEAAQQSPPPAQKKPAKKKARRRR
jgi:uncharacterized protein YkwD